MISPVKSFFKSVGSLTFMVSPYLFLPHHNLFSDIRFALFLKPPHVERNFLVLPKTQAAARRHLFHSL
jgi:hypothetical protein